MSHLTATNRDGLTAAQYVLALPELVHEIFSWVQVLSLEDQENLEPMEPVPGRLLSCARVNRIWNSIATHIIWCDMPMLSYVFTSYVRNSPNRQALASCVTSATYHTPNIGGPGFKRLRGGSRWYNMLQVEKRWLKGLEFSKLYTLTIQVKARHYAAASSRDREQRSSKYFSFSGVLETDLLPLIKCPALSQLIIWHEPRRNVGVLPEIWMGYLRVILVSLTHAHWI